MSLSISIPEGDGLEGGNTFPSYFNWGVLMTRKRDKIWTTIIALRQWFSILFISERDALVDYLLNKSGP